VLISGLVIDALAREETVKQKEVKKNKEHQEWREALTEAKKDGLLNKFKEGLNHYDLKIYKEKGLENKMIKGIFYSTFLSNHFDMPMPKN